MKLKVYIFALASFIINPFILHSQYNFNVKRTISETNHLLYYASYSSDGEYILTAGSDNSIIIWKAESGIIYRTLTDLKKRPNAALILVNKGQVLAGGEDNKVSVWDLGTMKIVQEYQGHQGSVKSLCVSPDEKYMATGSADKIIRVWDLENKSLIYELKGHKKDVNVVSFSLNGEILASGGADKTLILWNMKNGNMIASLAAHKNWIRDVAFSPDGKVIASCGDDNVINIWTLPQLNKVTTLVGHKDWVQSIDFSPDGKNLISGGHDQFIILWDINTGKPLYISEKQEQIILSIDISPVKPDFISASLLSDKLNTWAISGLNAEQWETNLQKLIPVITTEDKKETFINITEQAKNEIIKSTEKKIPVPVIEIYSPLITQDKFTCDKNEILIVGKTYDPEGINVLIINKEIIQLPENGVFQLYLSLVKGENPVNILAINNKGVTNEKTFYINSISTALSLEEISQPDIQRGVYYALLIGVNEYHDIDISDLDNPIKDVEKLYETLYSKYLFEKENIIVLKNPTHAEMIIALDNLGKNLTINDNLLIFYAGHGYWDEKGKVGYWFPSDASRNNTVNWFRNSTLRDFIGSIQTRHTLLVADACFSGAIFKTRAAFSDIPQGIEKLYELPSRKAMTSGILQEVPDKSVFLEYLIRRLKENQEKFLTSELLFSSFKTAVMNNSVNVPQYGIIQNVGDEGGDFIFIRR